MAIHDHVIASGVQPFSATAIVGGNSTALTATGTASLANALLLSNANNFTTTVAASSGVKLPACNPGSRVYVYNGGGSTLSVYGNTASEGIANGAAGAAFLVSANKGADFIKATSTLWGVNLSA